MSQTIKCIACKQEIPAAASICFVCKSYQRSWKNAFQYFSTLTALIALTSSALIWSFSLRSTIWPTEDVRVLEANSTGIAVVANFGDQDVYISHLIFFMSGRTSNWQAPQIRFQERLAPGAIVRKEFPNQLSPATSIARGVSEQALEDLIVKAASGDKCVKLGFFLDTDPALLLLSQMGGPTINKFKVSGFLEYVSGTSRTTKKKDISGSGLIFTCPPT